MTDREQEKYIRKLERRVERAEEQLVNYEKLVDRTQHLLNRRIEEVEQARADLERSEMRFRQLADAAFETIIIHAEGEIVDCNDAAVDLYGIDKKQLIGKPIVDLVESPISHEDREWLSHATEEPIEGVHVKVGGKVPVEVRSRAIELKGEAALVTVVRDITEHKNIQQYLLKVANTDPLTGVGNRRFFLERAKNELSRAIRYRQPMSLVMMDIDKFKSINDRYGHDIGDLALQAMADMCQQTLRESDIFARLGGEEFAAILPNTTIAGSKLLTERLRENIQDMVTETCRGEIRFTVSMGVTELRLDDGKGDIENMLSLADKGLYAAKMSGRNRVVTV